MGILLQKIIGIIPARGGSKGIHKKNIRQVGGKPLIGWTIETALSCPDIDRIIVSTDDSEIAQIAQSFGAEVPFIRPPELAKDDTPDLPVYIHALTYLAEKESFFPDIVVWLRPTTPLRTSDDISGSISLLCESKADWVRSVCLTEHHPFWMKVFDGNRLKPFIEGIEGSKFYRRQLLPPIYRLNGAVDVTWRVTIMEKGILYDGDVRGYVMPVERSIDIDNELDLIIAEEIMKRRLF